MKNKMFDMLNSNSDVDKIIRNSERAICGTFEREVIVKSHNVNKIKSKLKSAGYVIIGTGPAGFGRTKIWFNPIGANL